MPERIAFVVALGFENGPGAGDRSLELLELAAAALRVTAENKFFLAEAQEATQKLEARKLIERAKGLLQERRGRSEEQAYPMLRWMSRDRRTAMEQVAAEIVSDASAGREASHHLWKPAMTA